MVARLAAQSRAGILDASRTDEPVHGERGTGSPACPLLVHLNFRNILSVVLWAWKTQIEAESIHQ